MLLCFTLLQPAVINDDAQPPKTAKDSFLSFSNWNFWITFVVYASSIAQTFYLFVVVVFFLNQTEGPITDCSGDVTLWSRPYTCQFSIKHVYDINTETTLSHAPPFLSVLKESRGEKKKMKKRTDVSNQTKYSACARDFLF